jgi:hypothetical protein
MAKPLSRRVFVATAATAAAAAAGGITWKASRDVVPAASGQAASGGEIPEAAATLDFIETEGWLLTEEDLEVLPAGGNWIVETQ